MGQTTLLALALLCCAWWCRDHARPIACGVFAALASFKPSVSLFVIGALLLEKQLSRLIAMSITALALAWTPLVSDGPLRLIADWLGSVRLYMSFPQNRTVNPDLIGMNALLSSVGWEGSPFILAGAIVFIWAVLRRRYFRSVEYFGILTTLAMLFTNAHHYDLILVYPLLFTILISASRSRVVLAGSLAIVAVEMLPVRLLRGWVNLSVI